MYFLLEMYSVQITHRGMKNFNSRNYFFFELLFFMFVDLKSQQLINDRK